MPGLTFEEHDAGLSWTVDEPMTRTSHAVVDDDRRAWLIDPVDRPDAIERVQQLGRPTGVIQLLDRHSRDCKPLATRLGIPLHRLPDGLLGTPFEVVPVLNWPAWHERALWWPQRRTLVVAETIGTNPFFTLGVAAAGMHVMLRAVPPGALRRFEPDHLLVGHGPGVHGVEAAVAVRQAYDRSRRDIPRLLTQLPRFARLAR